HEEREAAVPPAGADAHQDSRAADLVRRCAAAARRARRAYRARRLARRAQDHLPRRPRAREGAPAGEVRLGHEDAVRRDRPHPRLRRAGRVDHPWQPPRRVGERRPGPAFRPGAAARGSAGVRDAPAAGGDAAPRISALGSGSDFTPFLQHAGIASLNLGYGGEGGGGVYHSIYDDFKWYTTFDDTSFVYGRALAQTVGTAVMRLADAELLPYEFGDFAETVGGYVRELQK